MDESINKNDDSESLHVLVIDDDPRLRRLLQRYLSENGFRISGAESAKEAREMLEFLRPDAIVLDVTMPGEDGLQLTHALREEGKDTPIILLTARGEPEDRIAGLEAGADDYLGKPFEPKELLLRLRAQLRRLHQPIVTDNIRVVKLGDMEFDPVRNLLMHNNEIIHLTGGEIALLCILANRPNEILSREEIVKEIGMEEIGERAVDVQITRLRRRIEVDPKQPRFLHTVRGKGYVLKPSYSLS
ncbi:DNA-binding response regulator [Commensalibacter papalotli (ex Botero et al. 2024)]|uniref:Two component response regulator OmpR n=3 Tax=Acetobacteraceae TaxID=433 RepID=W7E0S8_9PROT|nr:two component response regulator OmpR [Commensalibacter papalotli (ex Servin-Garciduenas et al. 2014)]CAI3930797.1 DNA-binding response regulator [Commensalibacter papalotli (ex Botero et al. 2024)]CAI3944885.1 DNA-binding response regulator [Commensalibacter papalotli (ex Botero et al. 2024)]